VLLFILESIGTSELILIGIIALIFLGPRKLPQIARTIGKTMADFRNTTNEFKTTWEREVNFEEEVKALTDIEADEPERPSVARASLEENTFAAPEIKPAQAELFTDLPENAAATSASPSAPDDDLSDKRSWL
jgi:sec-independent protein translocase protein TatB